MITLCFAICVFIGVSQSCEMPPPGPEIDWSRIVGKHWYEVVTNHPPIARIYRCDDVVFKEAIPDEYTVKDIVYTKNRDVEELEFRVIKAADGYYDVKFGQADVGSPEDLLENLKKTDTALPERQDEIIPKLAYYTDYENYLLILGCSPNDFMEFWYYAPNRNANAEDILRVTNILGRIGGGWSELQLYLEKCDKE